MKDIFILPVQLLTTVAKSLGPGGAKSIIAENLLLKQQLLVVTRSRRRAPNLSTADRFLMGFWSLFLGPGRIAKNALSIRPSTLLNFHQCLVHRKYRQLFSPKKRTKPGPKGPSKPLIQAIVELKRRNPRFGCPRIALIIWKTFGIEIDKNVVRRVLVKHYRPHSGGGDPSWLTFLGHMKDSLWSVGMFRCESIRLKSHWVLVVMDQFTCRSRKLKSQITAPLTVRNDDAGHRLLEFALLFQEQVAAPIATQDLVRRSPHHNVPVVDGRSG